MNDREARRYDVFGRVDTFGKANAADFAAGGEAKQRFTNLGNIITGLDQAKASQRRGGSTTKAVLLDALRLDVQNITRTARAMDQLEPGIAYKLFSPKSASDADLLTAADNLISKLSAQPGDDAATQAAKTALVAKFVAKELDANFVQHLKDDRKAIDDAQDDLEESNADGVESTGTVGRLIKAGMVEVNLLDAIMHNKYARNPDKLRAWQSACHIERAPQREKKTTTPTTTPKPT